VRGLASSVQPSQALIARLKEALLTIADVQVVQAEGEADSELAKQTRTGGADAAMSEDCDMITHGALKILFSYKNDGFALQFNFPFLQQMEEFKGMCDSAVSGPLCCLLKLLCGRLITCALCRSL
jgi:5'-3' exonuclease